MFTPEKSEIERMARMKGATIYNDNLMRYKVIICIVKVTK